MNNENSLCYFFKFDLIVTGEGEEKHLPKLFRSLLELGCRFKVIHRIGQLRAITSVRRIEKMIGSGQRIPSKDEEIGIKVRIALQQKCHYVLIIDDLERDNILEVFKRYRNILDTMLGQEDKDRASIHFLVNMLEAYYFADTTATNGVLGTSLEDYDGDVEEIPHPKNDLNRAVKQLDKKSDKKSDKNQSFKEIEDGGKILELLNVEKILENPETCASLRTIFAWCMKRMGQEFSDRYQLKTGKLNEITKIQI